MLFVLASSEPPHRTSVCGAHFRTHIYFEQFFIDSVRVTCFHSFLSESVLMGRSVFGHLVGLLVLSGIRSHHLAVSKVLFVSVVYAEHFFV